MTLNSIVFNKNEIYRPISFIDKLISNFGLLSKMKFDLENLCLNTKSCILIRLKKYKPIFSQSTFLSKIQNRIVIQHRQDCFQFRHVFQTFRHPCLTTLFSSFPKLYVAVAWLQGGNQNRIVPHTFLLRESIFCNTLISIYFNQIK